MGMRQAPRVALLGVGQRGLQHLAALWQMQQEGLVSVVALADAHAENIAEEAIRRAVPDYTQGNIRLYTRFADLLAGERCDALYVCIPPSRHRGEVVEAVERGWHVFVEKPMSLSLAVAQEMAAGIRQRGVLAAVGFQQRYDPWYHAIQAHLRDKRLVHVAWLQAGAVEDHRVKYTHTEELGGPASRVWTAYRAWSGTTLVEAGIHQTDLMRYWCGEIAWVAAHYVPRPAEVWAEEGDNPYAYSVTYGFTNGAVGNLILSRLARVFRRDAYLHVLWDHGHLRIEESGPVAYFYTGPYPPPSQPAPEALRHPLPVPATRQDSTLAINRAFLQAVATGDPSLIRSPFTDALRSLAAVLAANVSHALGGARIALDEFMEGEDFARWRENPAP